MKRRIWDLMDGAQDASVELNTGTPLSSERIKELTMSKIGTFEEKKNRKRTLRGFVSKVAIAAAVISAMTVTAAAAEYVFGAGDWFREIFGYGEKEVALVDELGKTFTEETGEGEAHAGVTSNGTTITPLAAYGDAHVFHLRLRVEAPEGTVLEDLPEDHYYQFHGNEEGMELTWPEGSYEDISHSQGTETLPDADPTDNVKEFLITWISSGDADLAFNDEVPKTLKIPGLWIQDIDRTYPQVLDGEWTFDVSLLNNCKVVPLDVTGLTYDSTGTTQQGEEIPLTVTVEKMNLSPLSLEWEIRYTEIPSEHFFPMLAAKVVLKDGTVVSFGQDGGGIGGDTYSNGVYIFDKPMDLHEIDHILVAGTHKVYLPE